MHKVERAIIMAAGIGKRDAAGDLVYAKTAGKGKWSADDRHCDPGAASKRDL